MSQSIQSPTPSPDTVDSPETMVRKEYQNRFMTIFEQSLLPMQIYDLSGFPLAVNKAWEELFQTTRESLEGYNVFHDPHITETGMLSYLERVLTGESLAVPAFFYDPSRIGKKGRCRWLEAWVSPVKDEQSVVRELAVILKDVTHAKEAEADQVFLSKASEILSSSLNHREILKLLCDHAIEYFCDGVIVDQLHQEGTLKRLMVVHRDPAIVRLHHKLDEDFPGRFENNPVIQSLITGETLFIDQPDTYWESMRHLLGDNYALACQNLEWSSGMKIRLKGRESLLGIITFFTNKTSNKTLTKRHIWLAGELAHRASMAFENALIHQASQEAIRARDEFLSIASHELKTPLQSLTLQNQMRRRNIEKKITDNYTIERFAQMVDSDLRHLQRINRLIDDMLDIARIRAGKLTFIKEKTEGNSFVRDVLERFRPQLDAAGCFLYTSFLPHQLMLEIDIYRTEQVLVNLLTNAMKYGAGRPIKVELFLKDRKLQILVHDKGPGILEEDVDRIFERFERAVSCNEVSGLGLGLYISRKIMQQNNGSLYVKTSPGVGSTFIMELPCQF